MSVIRARKLRKVCRRRSESFGVSRTKGPLPCTVPTTAIAESRQMAAEDSCWPNRKAIQTRNGVQRNVQGSPLIRAWKKTPKTVPAVAMSKTRYAKCRGHGSAQNSAIQSETHNVPSFFEDVPAVGETHDEEGGEECFKSVACGNADRGEDRPCCGQIDEKGPYENRGPEAQTERHQGGNPDPRWWPYGCGARMDGGQTEAQLCRDHVGRADCHALHEGLPIALTRHAVLQTSSRTVKTCQLSANAACTVEG